MRTVRRALLPVVLGALAACGDDPAKSRAAVTTLEPAPGPFNDRLTVKLSTDVPATLFVTTDKTDPRVEGPGRVTGASPLTLELGATTTLTFFSRTPGGAEEAVRTAEYVRAGGPKGTVSGVVVVGTIAVGKAVALSLNGQTAPLGTLQAPGELPFQLEGLASGGYRLSAIADRDQNGQFIPFLDYSSEAATFQLELADPFRSSVEGLRLYLGAPEPGLCAITGKVKVHDPSVGQSISISALSPDIFLGAMPGIPGLPGGGGDGGTDGGTDGPAMDPMALLSLLQNGYQVFTNGTDTEYPYAITGLQPGSYLAVPLLAGLGGGLGFNLIVNILGVIQCGPDVVATANFEYGPVSLSGSVTVHPAGPPPGFAWGLVVARNMAIFQGIQLVVSPVFFGPGADATELKGSYGVSGLRRSSTYQMRAFPSTQSQNPLAAAFGWAFNPLSTEPPLAELRTTTADTATQDLVIP